MTPCETRAPIPQTTMPAKGHVPFLSVIVPVYNGADTIVACVESLLAQDYPSDRRELIVVDNGSKDQTVELLQPYARDGRIVLLSETRVLNAYGARNTGVKASAGEVLAFTDADCIAPPGWLKTLLRWWRDEGTGAFIGDILTFEPKTAFERFYSSERLSLRNKDLSKFPGMRAGNCAVRRDCFQRLGGFLTNTNSGGDSNFLRRMVTETAYRYRLELDAAVCHKNFDTLGQIFRRGLRFGTNMSNLRRDPLLVENYLSWGTNVRRLLSHSVRFLVRLGAYPLVARRHAFRGRRIADPGLFLVEPLVNLTEMSGLLIGRVLKLRRFR